VPRAALSIAGPAALLALVAVGTLGASGCRHASPACQAAGAAETALATGCSGDADCALTRVPPGSCCPSLCTPRAVTRSELSEQEARCQEQRKTCPVPVCADRSTWAARCQGGRCAAARIEAR